MIADGNRRSRCPLNFEDPPYTVVEYAWQASGRSPMYYIYYLGITGAGHLNIAFVTRARVAAADFRVIPPQPLANGAMLAANRPMLGVRLDPTTFFWTGHARPEGRGIPAGGNDAGRMMTAINGNGVSVDWIFAGDLNRTPGMLAAPAGATTLSSSPQATHQGGLVLDYVVTNDAPANLANYNVVVESGSGSDHWPISAGST